MFRLPHCFSQVLYRVLFMHTRVFFFLQEKTNFCFVSYFNHFVLSNLFFFQMPCINLQRVMSSIRKHLRSCCCFRVSLLSPDEVSLVQPFGHFSFQLSFFRRRLLSSTEASIGTALPIRAGFSMAHL